MKTAPKSKSGLARWNELHGKRRGFLSRCEGYASVTLPHICLPDSVDQNSASIQHDWTSVGAQAVNHLTNKVVLSLFRPGVPFFRLDADPTLAKQLAAQGITEEDFREALVAGEQSAVKVLDQKAIRPKLNNAVSHLIVTGNVLLDLTDKDNVRVMGLKKYVAKRSVSGRLIETLVHERLLRDELEEDVQEAVGPAKGTGEQDYVAFVKWYRRKAGKWTLRQYVDDQDLGDEFEATYSDATFPLHVLTWNLADEHDYGTGLVEDYAGDLGTLSTLSEAEIKAALLAADYRWLANPAGVGDINEFKASVSGDVVAGVKGDLELVNAVSGQGLELISNSADKVIRRIGNAFLLGSAVTRNAERVTAEEIRMQAEELETSLGGVYSRLAVDLQLPLAVWLIGTNGVDVAGTHLVPTIVTGIAALSRNAEAQQLQRFLADMGQLAVLPPMLLQRLQLSPVISTIAAAHGILPSKYVKPEAQVAEENAAAAQAQQDAVAQEAVATEGAKALAQDRNQE